MRLEVGHPFDLSASLESGQAHRWRRVSGWHIGVIKGDLVRIRQTPQSVEFQSAPTNETEMIPKLADYFRLDDDLDAIYADIKRDQRVAEMVERYPGLRILRIEPWECLVSFICSANSNIPRIHQNMERMSEEFGSPVSLKGCTRHTFPTPAALAEAGLDARQYEMDHICFRCSSVTQYRGETSCLLG